MDYSDRIDGEEKKKKKSQFYLKKAVSFKDLEKSLGTKEAVIEESDLTMQTETMTYQFDLIQEPEKPITEIKEGSYSLEVVNGAIEPVKMELREYHLLQSLSNAQNIMNEGHKFFSRLNVYKSLKIEPKRAILLYSQPGVGKTASINAVCRKYLQEEGTVVHIWDTSSIRANDVNSFYQNGSKFSPNVKRLILVIEDIAGGTSEDDYSPRSTPSSLLNLLDGVGRPFKGIPTFIIGTTNNPEKSVGALIDRPGRFDKVIEVPAPNKDEIESLLSFYLDRKIDEDEKLSAALAAKSEFSIAHVQEAITRSKIDDVTVSEAIKQLSEHKAKVKKAFANNLQKLGF